MGTVRMIIIPLHLPLLSLSLSLPLPTAFVYLAVQLSSEVIEAYFMWTPVQMLVQALGFLPCLNAVVQQKVDIFWLTDIYQNNKSALSHHYYSGHLLHSQIFKYRSQICVNTKSKQLGQGTMIYALFECDYACLLESRQSVAIPHYLWLICSLFG